MAYVTLKAGSRPTNEVEIKRSRFLGFAARVETEEEARDFLATVRQRHREARHVCHAFVLGPDRSCRSSDDGEPAGTAGLPILSAILNRTTAQDDVRVSDVVVGIVRYFGGIKLGAGGLVQAYSQTTAELLDSAQFVVREEVEIWRLQLPLMDSVRVETSLRNLGFNLLPTDYDQVDGIISIVVGSNELPRVRDTVAELTAGTGHLELTGTSWQDSPIS